MAMELSTLRKLLALDPNDPLSRFAIGKKLFETSDEPAALEEAAEHLRVAQARSPEHLATYHILSQVLIKLNRPTEARPLLAEGVRRTAAVGSGMGRDLGPVMAEILAGLPDHSPRAT